MRKQMVAGNWKMNKNFSDAEDLLYFIGEKIESEKNNQTVVVVCPPFPYLEVAGDAADEGDFSIGAQNVSEWEDGAYTGEISANMLAEMGLEYCIVGHSERRKYFHETDQQIHNKVLQLLKNQIDPIMCCGEQLIDREANRHFEVVKTQIETALFTLSEEEFSHIVIAYEPVWAIGTGKTATPEQAQEMHAFIRGLIAGKYGKTVAEETTILYGGSCNAKNAKELFAKPDVDGGLIGGASLVAEDFIQIINAF